MAEHNGFDPWPQEFSIMNAGQGTLDWTLDTSGQSWLSVYPTAGTAPTSVEVVCHTTGLDPGMHTATITVTAPGASGSPADVTVHFEIIPGDIPERDTVRVASGVAQPGDQLAIPVYLHNINELAAFTVPLAFDPLVLQCDSISFEGTRIDYINVTQANIDNETGRVLFGMVVFLEEYLSPGDGEIAWLHMTVNSEAEEQVTVIDSAFFPPAGEFLLFDPESQAIHPEFVQSNIFIALNMSGDADGTGEINVGDCVFLVGHIFKGQRPPIPIEAGDANADDNVNVGDVVFLISYIFKGGPPPGYAKAQISPSPIYYRVEQVAIGDNTELHLLLDTDLPLGGIQFDIPDPVGFISLKTPRTGDLVNGMTIYQGNTGKGYRFGIFDMQGVGTISPGDGLVFRVGYEGFDVIDIKSLRVFDEYGSEMPTQYGIREKTDPVPMTYNLAQNYPNPFNPSTTIKYSTVKAGHVELVVFNVLGRRVKDLVDDPRNAGMHSVVWDGTNNAGHQVASGVYFYRLKTGEFTQSKKMTLIK
jgi:hypothetical protein